MTKSAAGIKERRSQNALEGRAVPSRFSGPASLLQAEAFFSLSASLLAYHILFRHHWILFGYLLFISDLSLLLFPRKNKVKAGAVYNIFHSFLLPALLAGIVVYTRSTLLEELSLIWISHISMDRLLGFGLKYPGSFEFTHFQALSSCF